MQIDPTKITDFERGDAELQAFWLFGCIVAGKNSDFAAGGVARLLNRCESTPFEHFRQMGEIEIRNALVASRSGNYTRITRFIMESLEIDLKNATQEQLMAIHGIGPKTASFFLLHSRPDFEVAVLDTHILKYLRDKHIDAPKSTPTCPKKYKSLQDVFLLIAKAEYPCMSVAQIDLLIWSKYSGRLDD